MLRTLRCARGFHSSCAQRAAAGSSATASRAAASAGKPSLAATSPRSGGGGGRAPLKAPAVFDFTKPVVPRHQIVFTPEMAAAAAAAAPAGSARWSPTSLRTGALALKCGMTADWDKWGVRRALTVLRLEDVIVTDVIASDARGYDALQVGAAHPKLKNLNKPLTGYFAAQGVEPRSTLSEFRITPDAVLPIGTRIDVRHFSPGQFVNVCGITQGKGFQGGMKRHGFSGQGASHGNSVSHRVLGSTGQRQDPGKVIKGKKMPGHMGEVRVTVEALRVYKIDIKRGLLFLQGAVPGKAGTVLRVCDAPKKPFAAPGPPFPTYTPTPHDVALSEAWAAASSASAFLPYEEERRLRLAGLPLPAGAVVEPPYELIAAPPDVDPFSIPENDEGEEK